MKTIYHWIAVVILPLFGLAASLFTQFFAGTIEDISIGLIAFILFVFLEIIALIILFHNEKFERVELLHVKDLEQKKDQINEIKLELAKREQDLREHTRGLWREFGVLNRIKQSEMIYETLENFTKANSSVIAVQRYSYFIQRNKDVTRIKIQHQEGYAMEGINQNALLQQYFELPSDLLKRYEKAVLLYRKTTDDDSDEEIVKLSIELLQKLSKIPPGNASVENAIEFAFYQILLDLTNLQAQLRMSSLERIIDELNSLSRTGILRGIIYDKPLYEFNYSSKSDVKNGKEERKYLTIKLKLSDGTQSIFVLTLENRGIETEVGNLSAELINILTSKQIAVEEGLQRVYN
ncbi:hypothetical protein [Mesobacillus maritimus]|uniref:hypothetical protein n=1 Tax=Mesobacillus maritimus TaxID=1643336 RepID=UPI00384D9A96